METGEGKGETSVTHVGPGEGSKSLWVFGELVVCKIASYRTGGAYSLFEVVTEPGSGPPLHVQHREDEAFYVLKGEYEFLVEDRTIDAGAGSLIYVPKGNLHAHINVGEGTGRSGKTDDKGVPKNIFELALLYEFSESYIVGMPLFLQKGVFGALAKLARRRGYDPEFSRYTRSRET